MGGGLFLLTTQHEVTSEEDEMGEGETAADDESRERMSFGSSMEKTLIISD